MDLVRTRRITPLDDLSGWEIPPPAAREAEPVRVFDTAEDAIAFLARQANAEAKAAS